jgi:hypothetical protein
MLANEKVLASPVSDHQSLALGRLDRFRAHFCGRS